MWQPCQYYVISELKDHLALLQYWVDRLLVYHSWDIAFVRWDSHVLCLGGQSLPSHSVSGRTKGARERSLQETSSEGPQFCKAKDKAGMHTWYGSVLHVVRTYVYSVLYYFQYPSAIWAIIEFLIWCTYIHVHAHVQYVYMYMYMWMCMYTRVHCTCTCSSWHYFIAQTGSDIFSLGHSGQ